MIDQNVKQLHEALDRIGNTLDQILEVERERTKSAREWNAADIQLRQALKKHQEAALKDSGNVQRAQRRFLLGMGSLAAVMLMVGIALVTEPWWLPALAGTLR